MKFSCYIILYSDYGFLDDVFKSIYNYVDEIIVVDGPYNYCIEQLHKLNLLYNEHSKPIELTNILNKYSNKIKYFYNTWNNEKEKRMFGYEHCTGDLVMLVDSDEIYSLNINKIHNFYNSNKNVAGLKIYNMCRPDIYMDDVEKYILFKKEHVNSLEHLSYTWLIGVDGLLPQIENYMDILNKCGTIYHQTMNREKEFNIIKFMFYTRLWYYKNSPEKIDYIWDLYTFDNLLEIMTIDEIKTIFYNCYFPSINLPLPNTNTILHKLNNIDIDLSRYSNNIESSYFTPNLLILNNLDCIFYLQEKYYINNNINIIFKTDNISECIINCYDICLDKIWDSYTFNIKVDNNEFNIKHELNTGERIGYVIKIKIKTIEGIKGHIMNII